MSHFDPNDLPEDVPPQIVAQLQKQSEAADDIITEINVFFKELSPEHLFTLGKLLHAMAYPDSGPRMASHYEGWVDAILTLVHNRCRACGKDHTDELLAGITPHAEEKESPEVHDDEPPLLGGVAPSMIDRSWDYPVGVEPFWTYRQTQIMRDYGLDDAYTVDEEGNTVSAGVVCKGCNKSYPSPEDRALREPGPEGCGGCRHKAMWG